MRRVFVLTALLAACADDPSGPSGPGVTTHVVTIEFPASMGATCIDGDLADVDPATPGAQYECSVSLIVTATQEETVLPQCNDLASPTSSTNKPCWAIAVDTVTCTNGAHLELAVERADQPPDGVVKAQCLAPS
jgi:hypothetical protein